MVPIPAGQCALHGGDTGSGSEQEDIPSVRYLRKSLRRDALEFPEIILLGEELQAVRGLGRGCVDPDGLDPVDHLLPGATQLEHSGQPHRRNAKLHEGASVTPAQTEARRGTRAEPGKKSSGSILVPQLNDLHGHEIKIENPERALAGGKSLFIFIPGQLPVSQVEKPSPHTAQERRAFLLQIPFHLGKIGLALLAFSGLLFS
mmetsp:Transcript_38840/g.87183  ORF Transcript_38840/g.87183 Transcript_38840/m.87183 type:complete len:203 (+) Transcript_38840:605-1213(+)